jgi:hypothetical protein
VLALKVSVAVPEPPVKDEGLIDEAIPVVLEAERKTVPEKLFEGVIVMMDEPVLIALTFTLAGLEVIE